ncbi:phosphotransferase enzyme family protein [Collimonas fungivorans]|uniref:Phosphotransferase enzyme family protein n=1 Tax=Collimonas fungivorans TaxID=158899 RepID=A0A127P5D7_9BURK|nr:serine/threonine-protein kinase [Collimonas fungivorans]AMO92908.1 phosphotransferase enzyme family protein [Collimonas fungivorans]
MQNAKPLDPQETTAVENCLPKGTRLADFEIIGVIGEGGFGIVYFAFDRSLRRMVAIKEYMPGAFAGRGPDKKVVVRSQRHRETFTIGLKSFIKEARLLAQFDHPALIKVYRFWEQNNTAYMAMRYYEGRTLKSVVQNSPAQVTEAWLKSMLKPMLEALDAMYRVQILHRDISPDNIMIQKSGEAVLLDFGAARQIIGDMTHSLTVILKPGYAPVEQYADDAMMKQGPWTDIYSLSAVIYFAIVKSAPPTSVARMIKDPILSLQDGEYSGFSKEFLAAIDKGLAVKPDDRPQSIEEFRKLLDLELSVPMPMPDNEASAPIAFRLPSRKKPGDEPTIADDRHARKRPVTPPSVLDKTLRAPAWWIGAAVAVLALGAYLWLKPARLPKTPVAAARVVAPASVPAPAPAASPTASKQAAAPAEQVLDEETIAWETLKQQNGAPPQQIEAFLEKYPNGQHAGTARSGLAQRQDKGAENVAAAKPAGLKEAEVKAVDAKVVNATGVISLTIKPWGNVLVDGSMKGVSPPLKKLILPEGKHQIKLLNPSFPDRVFEIDVSPKKSRNIDYDFSSH